MKKLKYESLCNLIYKHFEESTMRFFKSKLYEPVYCAAKYWFFVSSEVGLLYNDTRLFTVRKFEVRTGNVSTIGVFQGYSTRKAADKAAQYYSTLSSSKINAIK